MGDNMNLIYPAIVTNLITILLFMNSKLHDRYLLFIMIIGQLLLISGESDKNLEKIQISHILFTLTIVIGSVYFNEIHNKIFVLTLLLITISSRYILSECLFNLSNQKYEFEFESTFDIINYDYLFLISLILILFRLFKDKIMK